MRTQQAKLSFSAGVMSPRTSLRADSDRYSSAVRESNNFIISPQGGAVFREGFQHLLQVVENRLFQFHQGGNETDLTIDVREDSILIWQDITVDDTPLVTLTTIYKLADLPGLYFTNQETTGVILHKDYAPYYIDRHPDDTITGDYLEASLVPQVFYSDLNSPSAALNVAAFTRVEFLDGAADAWTTGKQFTFRYGATYATEGGQEPQIMVLTFDGVSSANTASEFERAIASIPILNSLDTTATVVINGLKDFNINVTGLNSGRIIDVQPFQQGGTIDRTTRMTATVAAGSELEPAWSYPTYVFHTANYYQCILSHKSEAGNIEPPDVIYWVDLGTTKPDTFDYQYPTGNIWADDTVYSPQDRGWPTVAAIHQQRMIIMSNAGFTMGIWGSRINGYRDFTAGPNDSDPFFFSIDTSDTPTIKWAESQQHLVLGTSSGDYNLSATVTLTPSDIGALKQNNARSHRAKAVTVNTDIIYIEQGNEKIRSTSWVRDVQARSSKDISLIAEHLLYAKVKRLVILHTPEMMVVGLRNDGTMIALSYAPEQGTGAWYELTSQGFVHDISASFSVLTGEDTVIATIKYGDNYYLEQMPYPSRNFTTRRVESDPSLTDQGIVLLDSWVTGEVEANNIITGLEHLEGQVVAALVEDAWTGTYTVTGGQITLSDTNISGSEPYTGTYAVGLLYKGRLETFEMATGNQKGVAFGTKRRWNRLFVRTLDSALPIINGDLPPDRTPATLMDIPETIRPGLHDHEMRNLVWGDGSILIEQDRPYPTHVIGMYGEFNSDNA